MKLISLEIFSFLFTGVYLYSFTIDYEKNTFLKDGKSFRYVSGSIHYFRVPWQFWEDRIYKMKMAGLNAIQTYVEWSHHEPEPGFYNFKDNYDLAHFLKIAMDMEMLVILRAGPFIDAERDMGGLPYWLLRINPNMKLRSYDKTYIKYVDAWYNVLLSVIDPFLYVNGGPIIMIQIENEYGSISSCDAHYKSHLRDIFRHRLKSKVVLFTTDGHDNKALTCGKIDEVFSTIDFGTGTNVSSAFELLRWHQVSGPLVNSEFYPGWLDHWGQPHANITSKDVVKTLTHILKENASVNVYMFHGGTSFGFSAGSNLGEFFQACPTSYDYDAPLDEAGDPTPKYYEMRKAIGQFQPLPPGPIPRPSPKMELNNIILKKVISLWDYIYNTSKPLFSLYPLSFEDICQPYGFVLYQTQVRFIASDPSLLHIPDLADRAYVYVNKVLQGILSREHKIYSIPIKIQKNEEISILVENQGRICSGSKINDRKGIFRNVTLGTQILLEWYMYPVKLDVTAITNLRPRVNNDDAGWPLVPAIYSKEFILPDKEIYDTYLKLDKWHKGVVFINGFNLGRYWPIVGPQITLYTPSILFKKYPEKNVLTLLELEHAPCIIQDDCSVKFVKKGIVNGTTPSN